MDIDIFKDAWVQGGAVLVGYILLALGNWLQWKQAKSCNKELVELAKDSAAAAERFRASADRLAEALNRNSASQEALTLRLVGR